LLLVHGGLDHSRSWDHLAQVLRRNFHVVAPDLRGHGESEWATGSSYSLADHVYDLTGLVKAAGFENMSIVGHSMGGMVGVTMALYGGKGREQPKAERIDTLDLRVRSAMRFRSRSTIGHSDYADIVAFIRTCDGGAALRAFAAFALPPKIRIAGVTSPVSRR
jgi:pimeloyl-ACP methyl ester carboxylesterase